MQHGLPAARGRVHAGRGRRAGPRPGGRRPPQLAAGGRARRRARTSSAPTSPRSSSTPARRSSSARTRSSRSPATGVAVTDFDGAPGRGHAATTSTGTSRPPRRAATTGSCARRSSSSRAPIADSLLGRHDADGRLQLDEMRISEDELRDVDKIIIIALRHRVLRRAGREVRHRALDPDPVRGRAGPRVPLPRPDPRPATRWWSRSASPARPPTR